MTLRIYVLISAFRINDLCCTLLRPNQPFKSVLKISLGKLDASKIEKFLMIRMIPSLFEELLRGVNGLYFLICN